MMRNAASPLERLLIECDRALRTLAAPAPEPRRPLPQPREGLGPDPTPRRHAAGLMRINHSGEVCAQALYFGHALATRDPTLSAHLLAAAEEEGDHLAWCERRLEELDSRPSLLNPLWYAGAYLLGAASAAAGDRVGLGFVVETERQVEAHLDDHLRRLPEADARSRVILEQMRADEIAHGKAALAAGGVLLPWPVPQLMHAGAALMKWFSYRI
jgi:ubiquinone biosynthesis monooxygenase Coq7